MTARAGRALPARDPQWPRDPQWRCAVVALELGAAIQECAMTSTRRPDNVLDVVFVMVTVGLFAVLALIVRGVERL